MCVVLFVGFVCLLFLRKRGERTDHIENRFIPACKKKKHTILTLSSPTNMLPMVQFSMETSPEDTNYNVSK